MSQCESDREGGISDHSSSEESTMIDIVPTRRLTVSHVNKKLEQFRGEVLCEQQSMMLWLKEQRLLDEKEKKEQRLLDEEKNEQRLVDEKEKKEQRLLDEEKNEQRLVA